MINSGQQFQANPSVDSTDEKDEVGAATINPRIAPLQVLLVPSGLWGCIFILSVVLTLFPFGYRFYFTTFIGDAVPKMANAQQVFCKASRLSTKLKLLLNK